MLWQACKCWCIDAHFRCQVQRGEPDEEPTAPSFWTLQHLDLGQQQANSARSLTQQPTQPGLTRTRVAHVRWHARARGGAPQPCPTRGYEGRLANSRVANITKVRFGFMGRTGTSS